LSDSGIPEKMTNLDVTDFWVWVKLIFDVENHKTETGLVPVGILVGPDRGVSMKYDLAMAYGYKPP